MRFGAAVITYQSAPYVEECLASLLSQRDVLNAGILVVDNASTDATVAIAAEFPEVQVVKNPANLGFAAAANQAFALLSAADAVLLFNPDARLANGFPELVRVLVSDPRCGVAAGLLLHADGAPQKGFAVRRFPTPVSFCAEILGLNRIWPGNPVNRRYRALDLDLSQPQEVEQPAGAFLLVRRETWRQLGGFDEAFFPAWFEDVDFLRRLRRAGWLCRLVPAATAFHHGGHSFSKVKWSQRQRAWYGNLLRYAALHFGPGGRVAVAVSVLAGLLPRMVAGMVLQRSFGPLGVYFQLAGLAAGLVAAPQALIRRGGTAGGLPEGRPSPGGF
jgi:GT2 family glycosyltransferase